MSDAAVQQGQPQQTQVPMPQPGTNTQAPQTSAYTYPQQARDNDEDFVINSPKRFRVFADSRPIGWGAFSVALLVLGFHTGAISLPYNNRGADNMVVNMTSLSVGGVAMFLAGLWCFPNNQTLDAALFTLYGAFFFSFGFTSNRFAYNPYASTNRDLRHSEGTYYLAWVLLNIIFWMASCHQSILQTIFHTFLELSWILLCAGTWTGRRTVVKAGGWFSFFASLTALYYMAVHLLAPDRWWFHIPEGHYYKGKSRNLHF